MNITLPINPRVRDAIEDELANGTLIIVKDALGGVIRHQDTRLLFADGLYQETPPFPQWGPVGADFILNYERFSAGLLSDDQVDKFLCETLVQLRVAHMRVIHPQLDIESMIQHLVSECQKKTSNRVRDDLIARKMAFGVVMNGNTESFDFLKYLLVNEATKISPMAIALGQSKELALRLLKELIDESLDLHGITNDLLPHIRTGILHNFLIAYPELWDQTDTEPYHFLGALMICLVPGRGVSVDKTVTEGPAGKSLILHPGSHIPLGLIECTLDYLVGIDPDVLDARHLLREGTRSVVWLDRCPNLEQGLPILERLLAHGLVHPAIERIENVEAKLSEAGKCSALMCYAEGGAIPDEMAKAIVEASPGSYDHAFERAEDFPSLQRLANLRWPSDQQLLTLSPLNKRRLLEGDLGI